MKKDFVKKRRDIETQADIESVVLQFYGDLLKDDHVGLFFTEVVSLDFEVHLPVIISFWSSILLGNHAYQGNPMLKHIELSRKMRINESHLERWLSIWRQTLDQGHEGQVTELAKSKAEQIGMLMLHKISSDENNDSVTSLI